MSDREKVYEIVNKFGVDPEIVKVVDVTRMRKMKEDDERICPVIVEYKSEYDKWKVLALKSKSDFERIFLEIERSREERERRMMQFRERKAVGDQRGAIEAE